MAAQNTGNSLRVVPLAKSRGACASCAPGHNVHWIQALRSANDEAAEALTWSGTVTAVDGEVVTVRKPDGTLALFRLHRPAKLVAILRAKGVEVTVNDRYCILRAGFTASSTACFSVHADRGEPLGKCVPARQVSGRSER